MYTPSENEFLALIIETLNLDTDVNITAETPLTEGELGLNSIDALEIGAAINQHYKVELKAKDEATHQAFASIRTLHAFVIRQMQNTLEARETNVA